VKIVFLVDSLHSIAAGSERQIYKLVEGLVASGHQVKLVLLRHTGFTRGNFDFPCPVECLEVSSIVSVSAAKKLLALKSRLKSESVDLVHAYFPDSCLLGPLYLKSDRLKVFTSRRDMGLIYKGKPAALYRLLRHRTDGVISNSKAVAELVREKEHLSTKASFVAYNGIEPFDVEVEGTGEAIYQSTDSIKLILVANIKPVKRNLDAVKAVRRLLEKGHSVELALVGKAQDKQYVEEIKAYIAETELESTIHWLGQVQEPRRLLKQADIGLLVSESEGLSNTLMEYMQVGLPVVATNVGGNPELVEGGVTGALVEKGQVDEIVAAISHLASDKKLQRAMGEAGMRKMTDEFSITAMVRHHEAFYSSNKPEKKDSANAIAG
jgi:glycosyltransferase involved in cell wall biosynthesis|tara:strand:- start:180 stop:1319 length:1140 start_codon:yes stop_codon:yes gene_type:complete